MLNTSIAVATLLVAYLCRGARAWSYTCCPRILISAFRGSAVEFPLFSLLRGCTPIGCRCAGCIISRSALFTRSCHLSAPLRAALPPSGCLHFHIRERQCSMLASPLVLARRQLPHQLPAAADLSLSGRSCSVYTRCACAVDPAFSGSSVASRLLSLLVCARLCLRMSPCRMHHLPSGFD